MICPECKKEGLKSKVYPGPLITTMMWCPPFYDEDGKLHNHDSNTSTTSCRCSNGHTWVDSSIGSCWCGWPEEDG
jgi:hypothetical protein